MHVNPLIAYSCIEIESGKTRKEREIVNEGSRKDGMDPAHEKRPEIYKHPPQMAATHAIHG